MRERLARSRWALGYVGQLPTLRARVRFLWWELIAGYGYEMCQDCGGRVMPHTDSWWHTDDELWIEVVEPEHIEEGRERRIGGGVLCPPCFTKRARAKGIHVFWHARLDWRDGEDIEAAQRRSGLRALAVVVELAGDEQTFTFFHEDGPIRVASSDVVTAFVRGREAVDGWRARTSSEDAASEGNETMRRLEAAVYPERRTDEK